MTEKKLRKVKRKPLGPLAGFKGEVMEMTYGHAIKVGMPSRDRYDPNHAMDVHFSMKILVDEEDDWRQVETELIDHVHATLEKASEERKAYWEKELDLD